MNPCDMVDFLTRYGAWGVVAVSFSVVAFMYFEIRKGHTRESALYDKMIEAYRE